MIITLLTIQNAENWGVPLNWTCAQTWSDVSPHFLYQSFLTIQFGEPNFKEDFKSNLDSDSPDF